MILAIIILSVLLGISLFVSYNLFSKNKFLLKEIGDGDRNLYAAVNVVEFVRTLLVETFATMQDVDKRGGFSSDDEVGFAFKAIYESIQQCKSVVDNLTRPQTKKNVPSIRKSSSNKAISSKSKKATKASEADEREAVKASRPRRQEG